MVTGRTLVHALVGALVGVVLSFIPFSTVIGGAVAGFLEGPDSRDGTVAGALAGAITFVPILGGVFLVAAVLGLGVSVAAIPLEGGALALIVMGFLSMIVLLYTVGLALLGGYLGAYLAGQYPDQYARTRGSLGADSRASSGHHSRPESWTAHEHSPRARDRERTANRDRWRSDDARAQPRDPRSRADDQPRADRPDSTTETFQPDPNDRLEPERWLETDEVNEATDATTNTDADAQSDADTETERNHETERDRE